MLITNSDKVEPLSLRSYGAESARHSHPFLQIVLPIYGKLEVEVDGRGGRLDSSHGAFILPGVAHAQSAKGANRFLILECDLSRVDQAAVDRSGFLRIPTPTRRLIDFVALSSRSQRIESSVALHCVPLLLDSLFQESRRSSARLDVLLDKIERSPGLNWTVQAMAEASRMSVSKIHSLFRSELGTTPGEWLSDLRLRMAQNLLANTNTSIAQLALQVGYSDQTALTRAMRRTLGITPAVYRELHGQ